MASADRPRRALIVVQNLPVPFDRRVWLEATTLAEAGYLVSVICPKAKGYPASFEVLENVHIYRYGLPVEAQGAAGFVVEFLWCFLRTTMKTARVALRGRGFEVLHICNPPEIYWPLARFWKLFGRRFLFDHHDLSPEMYQAKFGASDGLALAGLRWLERQTFRAADLVVTTNESHKQVAVERGGVLPRDVYVVRSGPDLGRLRVYPPDPAWRHSRQHLLVYLGEICRQDGVEHLVRALKLLRDDFGRADIHCVFVGGGPHQPAVKAYAEQIGVSGLCTFTGRVSDEQLCRILSSADVGVDPDPRNDWSDRRHDEQDHGVHVLRPARGRLRADREPGVGRRGRPVRLAESRARARAPDCRAARRPGPPRADGTSRPRPGAPRAFVGALGASVARRVRPAVAG